MSYQEIIATPSSPEKQAEFAAWVARKRDDMRFLSMVRENEIEAGLVHETPAMAESKRKLMASCRDLSDVVSPLVA